MGIEAVLDQLKIKAMKMGFEFNIMVVGEFPALIRPESRPEPRKEAPLPLPGRPYRLL